MSDYEDLIYEEKDGVAKITINRPDKMNAFRAETCEELIHALNRAGWNKDVGVIVLGGAGDRAFCTGGDQSAHGEGEESGYGGRGTIGLPIEDVQSIIRDVPKPVIAGDAVRFHYRVGKSDLRPSGPQGRLRRPRLGHGLSVAYRR